MKIMEREVRQTFTEPKAITKKLNALKFVMDNLKVEVSEKRSLFSNLTDLFNSLQYKWLHQTSERATMESFVSSQYDLFKEDNIQQIHL